MRRLLALSLILSAPALANDPHRSQPATEANASAEASGRASSDVTVDVPRLRFVVGGAGGSTNSTAPCVVARSGWLGVKTSRGKIDQTCWAFYVEQEEARLEVERLRAEADLARARAEEDRAASDRLRAERCGECGK